MAAGTLGVSMNSTTLNYLTTGEKSGMFLETGPVVDQSFAYPSGTVNSTPENYFIWAVVTIYLLLIYKVKV